MQLWPIHDDGPPHSAAAAPGPSLSTAGMLRAYTAGMRSLRRSEAQPRYRGAVLLLDGGDPSSSDSAELQSAARSLAALLHLPLYGLASDSLRRLDDATLMQAAPAQQSEADQQAHATIDASVSSALSELDDARTPQFLLIVSDDGVRAVQLHLQTQRGSATAALVPGGSVRVDLAEYKRVGSHGLDAFSPLMRACVTDVAAAAAAAAPTTPGAETTAAASASATASSNGVLVLDATMGAGRDSLMLASCGARVAMVEQDAVFALLMADGLRRAAAAEQQRPGGPLAALLPRLTLHFGDARAYMRSLQSEPAAAQPHCVYADPFYPDAPPSALSQSDRPRNESGSGGKSKKHMELLRLLWNQTRAQADMEVEAVADARFFATPSNRALRSLLLSALALPSRPRVVLKHPAAPFARRLLRDMDLHVERSYDSRDTTYHVMARTAEPGTDADAAAGAASSADAAASDAPPPVKSKQGRPTKSKRAPRTAGARPKKSQIGTAGPTAVAASTRSFHSVACHAQAASSADAVATPRPPSSSAAAATGGSSSSTPVPLPSYTVHALGHIRSCFPDRFSIPRQGCLAESARAVLTLDPAQAGALNALLPERSWTKSVEGLDKFSHLWIVFAFHDNLHTGSTDHGAQGDDSATATAAAPATDPTGRSPPPLLWRQTARPPRLGGKEQVGVFASRSPYRPNGIGMSAVRLERVVLEAQPLSTSGTAAEGCGPRVHLHLSGVDLLDGTPVLDVKPVIPYCDTPRPPVRLGWAEEPVPRHAVELHADVEAAVGRAQLELDERAQNDPSVPHVHLRSLLVDLLSLDPRHGHQQSSHPVTAAHSQGRCYGFRILDWNCRYSIARPGVFRVDSITSMDEFRASRRDKKSARTDSDATADATAAPTAS